MTAYTIDPCALQTSIREVLAERTRSVLLAHGEVTVEVAAADYLDVAVVLRDAPQCQFNQLIDLCAVDYSQYKDMPWEGLRFCVVLHLLSTTLNQRLRLKVFATDDEQPRLASVNGVWNAANWFEREAFDLFGVVFDGHPDLRRILTDYGFVGHPMRKDFPLCGHVEMHYDAEQKRVVYRPVSIEPREITPRIVRARLWEAGLKPISVSPCLKSAITRLILAPSTLRRMGCCDSFSNWMAKSCSMPIPMWGCCIAPPKNWLNTRPIFRRCRTWIGWIMCR